MKEYDVYEHIATGQRTEPLRVLFTFKWSNFLHLVVPSRMLQLYTINVLIEQSSVGAAYVLMANKAQMTYNSFKRITSKYSTTTIECNIRF